MAIRSIFASRRHGPVSPRPSTFMPIEQIRQALHLCVQDCPGTAALRVIYKIDLAKTPADLWLLRSDLHQCISHAHNQAEAARRINALLGAFRGWIPAAQLIPI